MWIKKYCSTLGILLSNEKEQTANMPHKTDEYPQMLRSQAEKCILCDPIYMKFKEKEI